VLQINLGCGSRPKQGWVNVDVWGQPGVDVVHDLDVFPWPFDSGTASKIHGIDVYEHVEFPLEFMAECWRVLKTGGELFLHTAYWRNRWSFNDPTHKRFLTENSFDYWIPGCGFYDVYGPAYNRGTAFEMVRIWLDTPQGDLNVMLRKVIPA
jgi:SAM-dependent methyltransferase